MRAPWQGDGRVMHVTARDGTRLVQAPWNGDGRVLQDLSASSRSRAPSSVSSQRQHMQQSTHAAQRAQGGTGWWQHTQRQHKSVQFSDNPDNG